ncbi:MAG: fused response regulator/phosphatase [Spirochaetes bacterium]|nr:fused response regulator/phosphatase [Spirochaetota bacterium]
MDIETTILIVDDAKINRVMLENIINQYIKCQTIMAENGEETFKILNEKVPDLILLDVILPDIDGFDIAKEIKNNPLTVDIPIIFITSLTDEDSKIKAFESGGIDFLTKPFSSKEVISRITAQLKLKRQYEEINKLNKKIMVDLAMAKKIQNVIMPQREFNFKKFSFFCKYLPIDAVGGDFYDLIEAEKNVYYIFLIDVTGHGIPAALYTMMLKSNLYYLTNNLNSPAEILNQLNIDISKLLLDDFYPTAVIIKLDFNKMIFTISNAAHPSPLFLSDNKLTEFKNKNFALAIKPDVKMIEESYEIKKGDKIFIFTDGIFELDNKDQLIDKSILHEVILETKDNIIKQQISEIIKRIIKKSGNSFFIDDVTLIGIDIL